MPSPLLRSDFPMGLRRLSPRPVQSAVHGVLPPCDSQALIPGRGWGGGVRVCRTSSHPQNPSSNPQPPLRDCRRRHSPTGAANCGQEKNTTPASCQDPPMPPNSWWATCSATEANRHRPVPSPEAVNRQSRRAVKAQGNAAAPHAQSPLKLLVRVGLHGGARPHGLGRHAAVSAAVSEKEGQNTLSVWATLCNRHHWEPSLRHKEAAKERMGWPFGGVASPLVLSWGG